jgi:hypothetical protein
VSHYGLTIYIFKNILRQKKELLKLKYFTILKYNLQKNPLKETKILPNIITLGTNLKFQHNTTQISSFKNPHIKIDLRVLGGPKSLKLLP